MDEITQIDTWIARTGKTPSVHELKTAPSETGSLSTLSGLRNEMLANRLQKGITLECGSPEAILIKTINAALQLLSSDFAGAAEGLRTGKPGQGGTIV